MNTSDINEILAHYETFNPIETFGNRQSATSNKKTERQGRDHFINKTKDVSSNLNNFKANAKTNNPGKHKKGIEKVDDYLGQHQDEEKQQTRIRLLSSFQESYLQSVSQPIFTEVDQGSNLKPSQSNNDLSYSVSKQSEMRNDRYVSTDPNDYTYEQAYILSAAQMTNEKPSSQVWKNKNVEKNKQKIGLLQLAIEQQSYSLSIQDRLYEYLISRIENRGRASVVTQKKKDHHLIIEKAIDFMDSGEQFMRELKKLTEMQND